MSCSVDAGSVGIIDSGKSQVWAGQKEADGEQHRRQCCVNAELYDAGTFQSELLDQMSPQVRPAAASRHGDDT